MAHHCADTWRSGEGNVVLLFAAKCSMSFMLLWVAIRVPCCLPVLQYRSCIYRSIHLPCIAL